MKPRRETLTQSVFQVLRKAIEERRWEVTLPGIRTLCEEIHVSRQTMMKAVRLLEKSAYVSEAILGKQRKIIWKKTLDVNEKVSNRATVAIITSKDLNSSDSILLEHLKSLIHSYDYRLKHLILADIFHASGASKIENLVIQNPADVYLVIGASPACSKVLLMMGIPVVYIGGDIVEGCQPRLGFSLSEMCDQVISYLTSKGHTKIVVTLPEIHNRKAKTATEAEAIIKKVFINHSLPFSTYNCPRWGKTREDYYEMLEKLFAVTPPTAIVLGDTHHLPRLMSFLMQKGLRYPDDLSVVLLDESADTEEYDPPISRVKRYSATMAQMAMTQLNKHLDPCAEVSAESVAVPTEFHVKGSIRAI